MMRAVKDWHKISLACCSNVVVMLQVRAMMRAVKDWRDCVRWSRLSNRPGSYLLSLLVIKAAQETHS